MSRAVVDVLSQQIRNPGSSHARGSTRPMVFVSAASGLGNRLRAWLGYRALSLCCDVPFSLCWEPNWACDAPFRRLFEPPPFRVCKLEELYQRLVRQEAEAFTGADWCDVIWRNFAADAVAWPRFMTAVHAARREIRFAPRLVEAADRFAREHRLSERIGIHIRNTDNVGKVGAWQRSPGFSLERVSSPQGFFREIERRPARERFFVATDNEALAGELAARHPRRVCQLPKSFRPFHQGTKSRPTSVETAAVELLLLGRCRAVIGTYYSSFSRLAAILGQRDYWEMWGERCVCDPVIPTAAQLLRVRTFRNTA